MTTDEMAATLAAKLTDEELVCLGELLDSSEFAMLDALDERIIERHPEIFDSALQEARIEEVAARNRGSNK